MLVLLFLAAIILGIVAVCYRYISETYSFFKKRNIPYLKPIFPLGNLWRVLFGKEGFNEIGLRLYREFPDARVFGLFQGLIPIYMIRDPQIIQRVLIKDFSNFHDRGLPIDEESNPLDGHLFNITGNKWKTLRNKLTPVLTSGKLKGMFHLMDECVDNFLSQMDKEVGKEIDAKDAVSRLTADVIGSCAFGLDFESVKDPDSEFKKMGKKMFQPSLMNMLKMFVRFVFPHFFLRMKFKSIPQDVSDFFFNVTKQNFELRLKEGIKRNDLMQLLLELREKGEVAVDPIELRDEEDSYLYQGHKGGHLDHSEEEKLVFTDDLLTAQAFIFFGAGFETSATGLTFAIYFLSKYPDAQEKLRQEVCSAKEKFGSFSYEAIQSMKYLEACINEALRMYTPIGTLFRTCNKTLKIDDELTIEEGNPTFISLNGIHMDPEYFPDPETFKPERFMSGSIIPGTFLPFGDGPRMCIAKRFALVELKLALAKLVDRYRIDSCQRMMLKEPIKLNPRAFFPEPIGGTYIKLIKRSN